MCRTTCRSCWLQLGLRDRAGLARKPDHDLTNDVLASAYEDVVAAVRERYDPGMGLTNPPGVPADDVAGLEIVRQWRENVWRNAERLVNAELGRRAGADRGGDPVLRGRLGARDRGGAVPRLQGDARRVLRPAAGRLSAPVFRPVRMRTYVRVRRRTTRATSRRPRSSPQPRGLGINVLRPHVRARSLRPCFRPRRSHRARPMQVGSAGRARCSSSTSRARAARAPERKVESTYSAARDRRRCGLLPRPSTRSYLLPIGVVDGLTGRSSFVCPRRKTASGLV